MCTNDHCVRMGSSSKKGIIPRLAHMSGEIADKVFYSQWQCLLSCNFSSGLQIRFYILSAQSLRPRYIAHKTRAADVGIVTKHFTCRLPPRPLSIGPGCQQPRQVRACRHRFGNPRDHDQKNGSWFVFLGIRDYLWSDTTGSVGFRTSRCCMAWWS